MWFVWIKDDVLDVGIKVLRTLASDELMTIIENDTRCSKCDHLDLFHYWVELAYQYTGGDVCKICERQCIDKCSG